MCCDGSETAAVKTTQEVEPEMVKIFADLPGGTGLEMSIRGIEFRLRGLETKLKRQG